MPNEGFALGFNSKTLEVCLDGKDGYPTVGTSRTWASSKPPPETGKRGTAIPKQVKAQDEEVSSEDSGVPMPEYIDQNFFSNNEIHSGMGLMGRIGLDN